MKDIHVKFAGIEKVPDSEELSIVYIPEQRQVLMPGKKYRIIVDGLSYEQEDMRKKK